eukprot:7817130-Pyramimonas_sp.AAC.1
MRHPEQHASASHGLVLHSALGRLNDRVGSERSAPNVRQPLWLRARLDVSRRLETQCRCIAAATVATAPTSS